jgi:hypothetical protein
MRHERIAAGQTATPKWTVCDRRIDISDIWVEEMDPENEDGATVYAYLHDNKYDDGMTLKGISIIEQGQPQYWDRARCVATELTAAIYRIEQNEMQAVGYDEYDIRKEEGSL